VSHSAVLCGVRDSKGLGGVIKGLFGIVPQRFLGGQRRVMRLGGTPSYS
jgi:hypothetical protein